MRNAAKNGQYAMAYGAGAKKLSTVIYLPPEMALASHARYRSRFPGVVALPRMIRPFVEDRGYVETEFGRRLYLSDQAQYKAVNFLVQATAADILKFAFVRVADYLSTVADGLAGILLPIHDELIIEYPRSHIKELPEHIAKIRKLMTDFPTLRVPMDTDVEIAATSWADSRAYA